MGVTKGLVHVDFFHEGLHEGKQFQDQTASSPNHEQQPYCERHG